MVYNDMPGAWPVWTLGAPLEGFINKSTMYCSTQNCGFGEEDFFYVFPIVSLWELLTPEVGQFLHPGA